MHLKMSSGKRRPFCLGLNVLTDIPTAKRDFAAVRVIGHHQVLIGLISAVKCQVAFERNLSRHSIGSDMELGHQVTMVTKLRCSEEIIM